MRKALCRWSIALCCISAWAPSASAQANTPAPAVAPYTVIGDAIALPLAGAVGDAVRGRAIGLDLFQVVNVKCGQAIAIFCCMVQ